MAIETAFENMQRQLEQLKEELGELRVNAEDFYPVGRAGRRKNGHETQEAPPPVVALADRAADLEGEVQEALQVAHKAIRAVHYPRNLPAAQVALGTVQRALNKTLRQYLCEVADYESLQTLERMGLELGEGWPKWTELIQSIVKDARDRLVEVFQALAECWQELADKLAANSVSVQATNIGQQITTREPLGSTVQEVT